MIRSNVSKNVIFKCRLTSLQKQIHYYYLNSCYNSKRSLDLQSNKKCTECAVYARNDFYFTMIHTDGKSEDTVLLNNVTSFFFINDHKENGKLAWDQPHQLRYPRHKECTFWSHNTEISILYCIKLPATHHYWHTMKTQQNILRPNSNTKINEIKVLFLIGGRS